jgi:integrase
MGCSSDQEARAGKSGRNLTAHNWQTNFQSVPLPRSFIGTQRGLRGDTCDFRSHDLRHTWASWHRQAGTSCDELKELGGWKSREMVDRYAKYATEHLAVVATRIERVRAENVGNIVTFAKRKRTKPRGLVLDSSGGP